MYKRQGGWGRVHKFLNPHVLEYCLVRSLEGDERNRGMAKTTLEANLALFDPVWGGVYQYSDSQVWTSPHFEKLMSSQCANIRIYSLAFAQFQDLRYLEAAERTADYLLEFLRSPGAAFYTSQDADLIQGQKAADYFSLNDEERRSLGIPKIDQNHYARENGMAIEALVSLYSVSGKQLYLERALESADWVLEHRLQPNGGFRHGSVDTGPFYLGDTLYCGKAFLALYRATSEIIWLKRAQDCSSFISESFTEPQTDGYFTSSEKQVRHRPENVDLSRFANLLHLHTGLELHKMMSRRALDFFAIEGVTRFFNPGGILLANLEQDKAATHISIVGKKDDEKAEALFQQALKNPESYFRLDFWQPGTALPPFSEIEYPDLGQATAFRCAGQKCSAPVFTEKDLEKLMRAEF